MYLMGDSNDITGYELLRLKSTETCKKGERVKRGKRG